MHHPSMDQAACQFSLLSYSCTRASFLPSLRHTRTLPTSWLLLLLKFQLPHNCTHPHNLPYHQFSFWQFCHGPPALSVSWLNFSRSFFNIRHTHDTGRSTARVVWDCGLPLSLQEGQRKGPFFLPRTAMAMRAPHSQSHCPPSYGAALFTHVMHASFVAQSCPTLCDPMDCSLPGSSVHGIPGKNTGVGCHALLHGIFPTHGSNPLLFHLTYIGRQVLYH